MEGRQPDRLFEEFRRTRDAALLAELFDRTAPEVLRVALHLAPSPADAEDLVQETFLGLLESLERYEPRGDPVPRKLGPTLIPAGLQPSAPHRHGTGTPGTTSPRNANKAAPILAELP